VVVVKNGKVLEGELKGFCREKFELEFGIASKNKQKLMIIKG